MFYRHRRRVPITKLETATNERTPLTESVAAITNSANIRSISPNTCQILTSLEDSVQAFQICYLNGSFQQVFSRNQPRLESGEQDIFDRTM